MILTVDTNITWFRPSQVSCCWSHRHVSYTFAVASFRQSNLRVETFLHISCTEITTAPESEPRELHNPHPLPPLDLSSIPRIPSVGRLISPVLLREKTLDVPRTTLQVFPSVTEGERRQNEARLASFSSKCPCLHRRHKVGQFPHIKCVSEHAEVKLYINITSVNKHYDQSIFSLE